MTGLAAMTPEAVARRVVALERLYNSVADPYLSPMRYLTADGSTRQWLGFLGVVGRIFDARLDVLPRLAQSNARDSGLVHSVDLA